MISRTSLIMPIRDQWSMSNLRNTPGCIERPQPKDYKGGVLAKKISVDIFFVGSLVTCQEGKGFQYGKEKLLNKWRRL